MTPAQPSAETVEVTQADRDAAAEWFRSYAGETLEANCIAEGLSDHWPLPQAFARHRLAYSTPPASDVIERAVAAERERCAQVAYQWWDGEAEDAEDLRAAIRRPQQPASDEGEA